MLWLLIPLAVYAAGLFLFFPFLGTVQWLTAFLVCCVGFISPRAGPATFLACLPIISYFTQHNALHFSDPVMLLGLLLPAVLCRLRLGRRNPLSSRGLRASILLLAVFAVTPLLRFVDLFVWYPAEMLQVFWLHLYHGDQLSPFASIYRAWSYALGIMLFFVIRATAAEPGAPLRSARRESTAPSGTEIEPGNGVRQKKAEGEGSHSFGWIYWGLLAGGIAAAGLCIFDMALHGRPPAGHAPIFEDRNTYAAFWVIQVALVGFGGTLWAQRLTALRAALFLIFSVLLLISLSLTGMIAWALLAAGTLLWGATGRLAAPVRTLASARAWAAVLTGLLGLWFLLPKTISLTPDSDSVLLAQMGERLRSLAPGQALETLRESRGFLWFGAWEMFRTSPVFGIGIGRYYQESGQYIPPDKIRKLAYGYLYPFENAHSYPLQLAAEVGIVGLTLFVLALYWLLARRWNRRAGNANTASGFALLGLLVMSLTGHPALVHPILFMAFALAAAVAGPLDCADGTLTERRRTIRPMHLRGLVLLAGVLLVLYAGHVKAIWNTIPEKFEWGFYPVEGSGAERFRWTQGLALQEVRRDRVAEVVVRALNPDLKERPVTVRILADGRELSATDLSDSAWHTIRLPGERGLRETFMLGIRTSRTWRPADYGPPDDRQLGVMVRLPEGGKQ